MLSSDDAFDSLGTARSRVLHCHRVQRNGRCDTALACRGPQAVDGHGPETSDYGQKSRSNCIQLSSASPLKEVKGRERHIAGSPTFTRSEVEVSVGSVLDLVAGRAVPPVALASADGAAAENLIVGLRVPQPRWWQPATVARSEAPTTSLSPWFSMRHVMRLARVTSTFPST